MPPEYSYHLGQGDDGIMIESQLVDEDGLPVNLTGAAVRFMMMNARGTTLIDQEADMDAPAEGRVSFVFGAAETAAAGLFYAQWEVTFSGGLIQTFPNDRYATVRILEEVPAIVP